ncbi:MAG: hypothetical protein LC714_02580 [Actinobacteria bacterium]|nr:hypothetical protein [Actinomycetota bacterium]
MPDRWLRVSSLVYRALLRVYPKEFRDAYGREMEQTFRDLCREKRRRGGAAGLVRLWVRVILDFASTAVVERVEERKLARNGEVNVNERRLAWAGLVLLSAPLFFVAASVLKYELGIGFLFDPLEVLLAEPGRRQVFNLVSPVVFLGGLGLALVLNAYAVVRLDVGREDGAIVSTVRLEVRFWNIAVAVMSLLLLATLLGYFFVENFVYRP